MDLSTQSDVRQETVDFIYLFVSEVSQTLRLHKTEKNAHKSSRVTTKKVFLSKMEILSKCNMVMVKLVLSLIVSLKMLAVQTKNSPCIKHKQLQIIRI